MSGAIRFAGREIRGLPPYRIAQLGIGLVPEGRQIFPNLTARENLVATAVSLARVCSSLVFGLLWTRAGDLIAVFTFTAALLVTACVGLWIRDVEQPTAS